LPVLSRGAEARACAGFAPGRRRPLKEHLGSLNITVCLPDLTDFRYRLIGARIAQRIHGEQGYAVSSDVTLVGPQRVDSRRSRILLTGLAEARFQVEGVLHMEAS
jgi:hypothetical protein